MEMEEELASSPAVTRCRARKLTAAEDVLVGLVASEESCCVGKWTTYQVG